MALLLVATAGCGEEEYGILIRAYGSTPSALLAGTTLRISVRDLRTGRRSDPAPTELDRDTCTPADAPETDCPQEPRPADHLRIAVELKGPGQYMVHLTATGADGTFTATRCYTVVAITESEVLLVGPVLDEHDADADGWTATETCRERDLEEVGCKDQCPDLWGLDCDDEDPETNPTALEQCEDGLDQDCDGVDATCADNDGDTYNGCPPDPENCCNPEEDPECDPVVQPPCVDRSTCDCDDGNTAVNPGVTESSDPSLGLCDNGVDEDCDGRQQRCDDDGDGVIECGSGDSGTCDCDDENPAIYPGAPETPDDVCDGLDNNCNELIDEVEACLSDDLDGDGSAVGDDCNDCAASMSPLEDTTICADDIDENCSLGGTNDGRRLPPGTDQCQAGDADGDGFVAQASGGTDCDDGDAARYPGAPDDCRDGVDGDCSGSPSNCNSDGDADGYNADNDCDDGNAGVHPGVSDPCNGADDDCDGVVDENVPEGFGCILSQGEWTEIDFQSDLQHCGNCRHNCNPGCDGGTLCKADGCTDGGCTCGGGEACDGTNADFCCPGDDCRDLTRDIFNCGRCGQVCTAPDCQVPVCNDGVCGTEWVRDGDTCPGNRFCCDGECRGVCAPGTTSDQGCGDCGTQYRDCDAECNWGPYGSCQAEGVCTIGNVETRACGNCGDQDRICQGDCSWSDYGVCYGQGVCSPGSNSSQGCGNCGSQSRTCQDDCSWGSYGACGGQGACTPNATESRACGNCGTQTRTCAANCTWGNWGACGGEGVCAPGATSNRGCGNCGTQTRTCQAGCTWGAYGACGGEGVCAPGATSSQGCGNCGSQSRTCTAGCAWGSYGSCGGEGPCAPGTNDTQSCGNCGSQSQTCNGSCQWPGWGACTGEGECASGGSREVACNDCGNQHQNCDASCTWVDSGSCDNTPARSCDDSDLCTTDTCGATGNCSYGNCGGGTPNCCGVAVGCRECCNAGQCPDPGVCQSATCSGGGSCGGTPDPDGSNCGAGNVCCGGACEECCTGAQCGGGTPLCCVGSHTCEECCVANDCRPAQTLCRDWTCNGSNQCVITFEGAGTDPELECAGTQCCDGAGGCVAGSCP